MNLEWRKTVISEMDFTLTDIMIIKKRRLSRNYVTWQSLILDTSFGGDFSKFRFWSIALVIWSLVSCSGFVFSNFGNILKSMDMGRDKDLSYSSSQVINTPNFRSCERSSKYSRFNAARFSCISRKNGSPSLYVLKSV